MAGYLIAQEDDHLPNQFVSIQQLPVPTALLDDEAAPRASLPPCGSYPRNASVGIWRWPLATWIEPPDEGAANVRERRVGAFLDRSDRCGTPPRTDARRPLPLPARPNSLCA